MSGALSAAWVAKVTGGHVAGRGKVLAPGPTHGPTDRSLSIHLDPTAPDGFRVHSFSSDDPLACKDHVRAALGLPAWQPERGERRTLRPALRSPEREAARLKAERQVEVDRQRGTGMAMRLWGETKPARGTVVEAYLRARGLELPEVVTQGNALRFHPAAPFRLDADRVVRLPSMVCLQTDALTAKPVAVHRTALREDGSGKADLPGGAKKMLGPAAGTVIRLCADDDVTTGLCLGEGIENSLAVLLGGEVPPVWAAASADNMRRFPVLPGVEALLLAADRGEAGEAAARACKLEWEKARREVLWLEPPDGDWNTVLAEQGEAA